MGMVLPQFRPELRCPQCSYCDPPSEGGGRLTFKDILTCDQCGYEFVFNPKIDKISDVDFLAVVLRASADGSCYFTANQLYAAYRAMRRGGLVDPIVWSVLAVVALLFGIWFCDPGNEEALVIGIFGIVVAGVFGAFAIAAWAGIFGWSALRRVLFDRRAERWQWMKRPLAKLVSVRRLGTPPDYPEKDVDTDELEKLLIVDDDLLVDLLVLNGFHTQERTLVVSTRGYPEYLLKRAKEILELQPWLPVYFLHAASHQDVPPPSWLPAEARNRLVDLGLFPEDVKNMGSLRCLNPRKEGYELPVDMLAYGTLSGMLSTALAEAVPLGTVLAERRESSPSPSVAPISAGP